MTGPFGAIADTAIVIARFVHVLQAHQKLLSRSDDRLVFITSLSHRHQREGRHIIRDTLFRVIDATIWLLEAFNKAKPLVASSLNSYSEASSTPPKQIAVTPSLN